MIAGATTGRGGAALGRHLALNDDAHTATPGEARGLSADTTIERVRELTQLAEPARSKSPLYHAFASPGRPLTGEQWTDYWQRFEAEFGLGDRPFAEAIHRVAGGDEHRHRVYLLLRDNGTTIALPHEHRRREKISRAFEIAHGLPVIAGAHNRAVVNALRREGSADVAAAIEAAGLTHGPRPRADVTPTERHADARTGSQRAAIRAAAWGAWTASDSPESLRNALESAGLRLAAGDRAPVLVDAQGGTHPVARAIRQAAREAGQPQPTAADVHRRVLDAATPLPLASELRAEQRQAARAEAGLPAPVPVTAPAPTQPTRARRRFVAARGPAQQAGGAALAAPVWDGTQAGWERHVAALAAWAQAVREHEAARAAAASAAALVAWGADADQIARLYREGLSRAVQVRAQAVQQQRQQERDQFQSHRADQRSAALSEERARADAANARITAELADRPEGSSPEGGREHGIPAAPGGPAGPAPGPAGPAGPTAGVAGINLSGTGPDRGQPGSDDPTPDGPGISDELAAARRRDAAAVLGLIAGVARHHAKFWQFKAAVDAGAPAPAEAVDVEAATERLRAARQAARQAAWDRACASVTHAIEVDRVRLSTRGRDPLAYQQHKLRSEQAWRNLRSTFQTEDWSEFLRRTAQAGTPDTAREARLLLALADLRAIQRTEVAEARQRLGVTPPHTVLSVETIHEQLRQRSLADVRQRQAELATAQRAATRAEGRRSILPWSARNAEADAAAAAVEAAQARLDTAQGLAALVAPGVRARAETEAARRQAENVAWQTQGRRIAERDVVLSSCVRLAQSGDRGVQDALLDGGPSAALALLRQRQLDQARQDAEAQAQLLAEREERERRRIEQQQQGRGSWRPRMGRR